jgi:SWI/SNF-related matrix-associated actin-dependent regulator of chromatin subfamily A-like protein 1
MGFLQNVQLEAQFPRRMQIVDERIVVYFPYSAGMVSAIKELPDRKWNPEVKRWSFPATPFHAQQLKAFANLHGFWVEPSISQMIQDRSRDVQVNVTKELALRPYQVDAVKFLVKADGKAIVADSMGLGKTVEVLAYIREVGLGKILVICPSSVKYNWQREISRWIPEASVFVVNNGKQRIDESRFLIISYELMANRHEELSTTKFDLVVCDECHNIKNRKTIRFSALERLNYHRFIGMSGTPFLNKPAELWGSLHFVNKGEYSGFWKFAQRYCGATQQNGWDTGGLINTTELKQRLNHCFIRRTKEELKDQLPMLSRTPLDVDINDAQYNAACKKAVAEGMVGGIGSLRHALGMLKVPAAFELATTILEDPDEKVVLYCWHLDVIHTLAAQLSEYGTLIIEGETLPKKRDELTQRFLNDPSCRVMLITQAGGEGINLYSASHLIMVERSWNPGREEQVEGRIHRIGQTKACTAYYLIARNTLDKDIDLMIEEKRFMVGEVIGNEKVEKQMSVTLWSKLLNIMKGV